MATIRKIKIYHPHVGINNTSILFENTFKDAFYLPLSGSLTSSSARVYYIRNEESLSQTNRLTIDRRSPMKKNRVLISFFLIIIGLLLPAYATNPSVKIEMVIGSNTAYKDGHPLLLDPAPMIIDGRTYVPLRFLTDSFGGNLDWDGATQTITYERDEQLHKQDS